MEVLPGPVTNSTRRMPDSVSSSITYCTTGLRPTGSISLGWLLVDGSSRVPCPATGTMARSMLMRVLYPWWQQDIHRIPALAGCKVQNPSPLGGDGGVRGAGRL